MKKYITSEQAETLNIDQFKTKSIQCDCGQSYAIITEDTELIVCDACHENADNLERQF